MHTSLLLPLFSFFQFQWLVKDTKIISVTKVIKNKIIQPKPRDLIKTERRKKLHGQTFMWEIFSMCFKMIASLPISSFWVVILKVYATLKQGLWMVKRILSPKQPFLKQQLTFQLKQITLLFYQQPSNLQIIKQVSIFKHQQRFPIRILIILLEVLDSCRRILMMKLYKM